MTEAENCEPVWLSQTRRHLKRKNRILFSKDCPLFDDLGLLLSGADRRAVILWALELARQSARRLEDDSRAAQAIIAAEEWAAGHIKMPIARRAILSCHAAAREQTDPVRASLFHAIGQACSVVHTPGHALGYPLYELSATVYSLGIQDCRIPVEQRVWEYETLLLHCCKALPAFPGTWVPFLMPKEK